jgi:hypothetical protein
LKEEAHDACDPGRVHAPENGFEVHAAAERPGDDLVTREVGHLRVGAFDLVDRRSQRGFGVGGGRRDVTLLVGRDRGLWRDGEHDVRDLIDSSQPLDEAVQIGGDLSGRRVCEIRMRENTMSLGSAGRSDQGWRGLR